MCSEYTKRYVNVHVMSFERLKLYKKALKQRPSELYCFNKVNRGRRFFNIHRTPVERFCAFKQKQIDDIALTFVYNAQLNVLFFEWLASLVYYINWGCGFVSYQPTNVLYNSLFMQQLN